MGDTTYGSVRRAGGKKSASCKLMEMKMEIHFGARKV